MKKTSNKIKILSKNIMAKWYSEKSLKYKNKNYQIVKDFTIIKN
jgi:hypothetical protein